MNAEAALAALDAMMADEDARLKLWRTLTDAERAAICTIAKVPADTFLTARQFDKAWQVVARFCALAARVQGATARHQAALIAAHNAKVAA